MNNKEHRTRWFHVAAHGLTALVMGYFITWVAVNITLASASASGNSLLSPPRFRDRGLRRTQQHNNHTNIPRNNGRTAFSGNQDCGKRYQ